MKGWSNVWDVDKLATKYVFQFMQQINGKFKLGCVNKLVWTKFDGYVDTVEE